MRVIWFRAYHLVKHVILAQRNNKGFGVQAPFAYDLLQQVVHCQHSYYVFDDLSSQRSILMNDRTPIVTEDYGAKGYRKLTRQIRQIAARSVKPQKQQELLFRLARYAHSQRILELGTSLGLTTAYLAASNTKAQVVTMEACHATAGEAIKLWKRAGIKNITLVEAIFEDKLPSVLARLKNIDFAFFDGNHRGDAVFRYFEQVLPYMSQDSLIVVDDIYWSQDMYKYWRRLKVHPSVRVSFDLFHMGILLVNSKVTPGHYRFVL